MTRKAGPAAKQKVRSIKSQESGLYIISMASVQRARIKAPALHGRALQ